MQEMYDTLDEETIAKWQAVAAIDGWGGEYERTAMICSALHNAIMVAAAKQGGTISESDFRDVADFVPKFRFERPRKPKQTSAEMVAIAKSIAGVR